MWNNNEEQSHRVPAPYIPLISSPHIAPDFFSSTYFGTCFVILRVLGRDVESFGPEIRVELESSKATAKRKDQAIGRVDPNPLR